MSITNKPFLYPNVTSIPSQQGEVRGKQQPVSKPGEFEKVFKQELIEKQGQIREPLKFSAHANQRLQQRNIQMDDQLVSKLNEAVERAEAKGIDDTLVLTEGAAFIVNIPNRTVVTALDKSGMNGNVFTNIDGAIVV